MVKVSYVCPIYNKSQYLKDVTYSIKNQVGEFEKEYIFVDDGSNDNSISYLQKYTKDWRNIKILSQSNFGPAIATQRGIDAANGDYIKLVGGDDIMEPNCTKILLDAIIKSKSVAVFSRYKLLKTYEKIRFNNDDKLLNIRTLYNPILATIKSNFSGTTPTLYEHSSIKTSGGCNKKVFIEDFSLALGLSKFGSFTFIDNVTSYGPEEDKNRIMNSKKTQLLHDYNAALYYFIKDNDELEPIIKRIACKKALGRSYNWCKRNKRKSFVNIMLLLKISLITGRSDYHKLIRKSCRFFYDKVEKDEIRNRVL